MSTLDSRSLAYVNTFGRRFGDVGTTTYRIVSAGLACQPAWEDMPFTIHVAEGEGGAQHEVFVRLRNGKLVADPQRLSIATGDFVLWHSAAGTPAYVVQGAADEGDAGDFDSSALTSETLYTHAFGVPGDYEWTDANGGSVCGVVHVTSMDSGDGEQCRAWMNALEQGTVVTIEGDRCDPPEISIVAGQTVFFAVCSGDGIAITDCSLVSGEPGEPARA